LHVVAATEPLEYPRPELIQDARGRRPQLVRGKGDEVRLQFVDLEELPMGPRLLGREGTNVPFASHRLEITNPRPGGRAPTPHGLS
jgi:hypothetical protein